MIQVNQLYITPDNKYLVIDAQIIESTIFAKVTFDSIAIDNQDTYSKDSISEKATIITDGVSGERHVYITKPINEIGDPAITKNPMLFVYFIADASAGLTLPTGMTDIPCTWDDTVELEVVCNMQDVYNRALNYIREMSDDCSTPNGFIDFILQYNLLKACLNSGAFNEAIKWWKRLTEKVKISTNPKPCGCRG